MVLVTGLLVKDGEGDISTRLILVTISPPVLIPGVVNDGEGGSVVG